VAHTAALSLASSLWRWRKLIKELALREVRARHAGSVLGAAWSVLEPLIQFMLYLTVFSYFLGMRLEGRADVGSFALYLVAGLVPFQALQEALGRAAALVRQQAGLVRYVNVPLEVLVAAALLAVAVRHAVMLALVAAAALAVGTVSWAGVPLLAAGALVLVAAVAGLSLILVPAGAYLPDLPQVVATATSVLFFMTPIVYLESMVPAAARPLLAGNPLVGVVEAFRAAIIGGAVAPLRLAYSAAAAAALLVCGVVVFAARSRAVRDLV
jgi:lipopolysaccharide transport system permease protein